MPTEHWFSTPIYYNIVDNVDEVQKEFHQIMENISFHKTSRMNWDKNSAAFSNGYNEGENFLNKYNPSLFLNELQKNLFLYFKDLNFCPVRHNVDVVIKDSWLTRTQKNEYHHRHLHSCSEISGVYYIKTNGNEGSINFHPPSKTLFSSRIFLNQTKEIDYEPMVGRLILFPSLIEHHVISNQTDDDRISLSFNIILRDRV